MAVLILSSFRGKDIPYDTWLSGASKDIYLLCSDEQNISNHPYAFAQSFASYETNDAVIHAATSLIGEKNVDTIIAKAECDLLRAAKLRDQFKLRGQSYEQALAFRDKVVMKSYLEKHGVAVPQHQRLSTRQDAILFSKKHGFPLIIKPTDGAGSLNTFVIHNEAELAAIPENMFTENMEIEVFIEGDMYHIDGIVLERKVSFIYPSRYLTSCLGYQNNEVLSGLTLSPQNPLCPRLTHFVQKALKALPTPSTTTFHAEVFHTKKDGLVFCEIASRTGGARIARCLEAAFGFDLDKIWIQAQIGIGNWHTKIFPTLPKILSGWVLIPPQKGTLVEYPNTALPEWVVEYRKSGVIGKAYENPKKSTDCIAGFVVTGNDEEEVADRLLQMEDWFKKNVRWKN